MRATHLTHARSNVSIAVKSKFWRLTTAQQNTAGDGVKIY